jgi:hypothetical protein
MTSIVTFYSYKGGVGRSMTLANVAVLLAQRGLRVLAVDWDLEAPGLERYFSYFAQAPRPGGLLPLFTLAMGALSKHEPTPSYADHVWEVALNDGKTFKLLPSGRDNHADYAKLLEGFDWPDFFAAGGGEFIESLRNEWRREFDIVLIDSRTGMSDSGGICTIQMPDVLVAMFTANEQSMNGVRDIIDATQRGRQRLAYDRMPLSVLPILCRFASGTEIQESAKWLDVMATKFAGVCDDWRPPWVPLRPALERLKVPQIDFYGFGERLAVVEQGVSDPGGMGYAFDRIADLLGSEFSDLEGALGTLARKPADWQKQSASIRDEAANSKTKPGALYEPATTPVVRTYEYDVFVSYRRGGVVDEWVRRFVADLGDWLSAVLVAPPKIFLDEANLQVGSNWNDELELGLLRSKLLVAVLTPAYFASPSCSREWSTFEAREKRDGPSLILPVLLRGQIDGLPKRVASRQLLRAPEDALVGVARNAHDRAYAQFLNETANHAANLLKHVPPFDPHFRPPELLELLDGSKIGDASTLRRTLRSGMSGPDVSAWQSFLNGNGFDAGPADGQFGSLTANATRAFQSGNGLPGDGIAGKQTLAIAASLGFSFNET